MLRCSQPDRQVWRGAVSYAVGKQLAPKGTILKSCREWKCKYKVCVEMCILCRGSMMCIDGFRYIHDCINRVLEGQDLCGNQNTIHQGVVKYRPACP